MFCAPVTFAIEWFSIERGNTMPRGDGKAHPTQNSGSCKSCLSAWSGCNFGVIYSNYSFNLNHNWMLQVAQPVLLRLEHPHWVRLVYKSSKLNIFIKFLPCFTMPFSPEFKHWQFIMQQLLSRARGRTSLLSVNGTTSMLIFPTKLLRFETSAWLWTAGSGTSL